MAITFVGFDGDVFTTTQSPVTDPPAGIQDGDIILAIFTSNTVHDSSGTPPTGWTKIAEVDENSDSSTSVFWKRASSEGATTWTNIFATTETGLWATVAYRGCVASGDPQDATATTETSTSGTAKDTPSITTVTANAMVIGIIGTDPPDNALTFTWDGGIDERVDGTGTSNAYIAVGDKILASPGATTLGGDLSAADTAAEFTIALKPASGAQTISAAQTTETDTANALTRVKSKALGQNTETDTAQALTKLKQKAIGQTAETELAQAIQEVKSDVLGQPSETDLAQPITWNPKKRILGQPSETDSAQAVTWNPKKRIIGQATETETAQPITRLATPRRILITWAEITLPEASDTTELSQAVETELAQAVTAKKTKTLGTAYEQGALYPGAPVYPGGPYFPLGDSGAMPINATRSFAIGQAQETDTAQAIAESESIGQPVETDTAQPITRKKSVTLGQATETDTAQALAGGGNLRRILVTWAEISLPQGAPVTTLGQAEETEQALPITVVQAGAAPEIAASALIWLWGDEEPSGIPVTVNRVTETELAQPIAIKKTKAIGQATETDTAGTAEAFRFIPVGQAQETELAQPITPIGGDTPIPIGQVTETETAMPVTWKMVRLVGMVEDTQVALDVFAIGGLDLAPEQCDDLDLTPLNDGFDAIYPGSTTYPSSTAYPSEGSDQLGNLTSETEDALVLVPA